MSFSTNFRNDALKFLVNLRNMKKIKLQNI